MRKGFEVGPMPGQVVRKLTSDEEQPAARARMPRPPAYMTDDQKRDWSWLCKTLRERRILTLGDSPILEQLVLLRSDQRRLRAVIDDRGDVMTSTWTDQAGESHEKISERAESKKLSRVESHITRLLAQLGATPVTRDRARPAAPAKKRTQAQPAEGSMTAIMADEDGD